MYNTAEYFDVSGVIQGHILYSLGNRSVHSTQEHLARIFDVLLDLVVMSALVLLFGTATLTLTRKTTASLPSSSRWSYVSARYIIW
jgi:hypothetical protein